MSRTKETVVEDLTRKLLELPESHADEAVLTRMIRELSDELKKERRNGERRSDSSGQAKA